jgi:hypothetical protein
MTGGRWLFLVVVGEKKIPCLVREVDQAPRVALTGRSHKNCARAPTVEPMRSATSGLESHPLRHI